MAEYRSDYNEMNLNETEWDRIPPMSRTVLGGPGAVEDHIG